MSSDQTLGDFWNIKEEFRKPTGRWLLLLTWFSTVPTGNLSFAIFSRIWLQNMEEKGWKGEDPRLTNVAINRTIFVSMLVHIVKEHVPCPNLAGYWKAVGRRDLGMPEKLLGYYSALDRWFAQNATNLCCGRVISKCVCLMLRPRGPMSGVHSHPASRCVCYLLGVHCMPVAEVRKKIETATQSAMSRDDFNPTEMCFSLAFCVQTWNSWNSINILESVAFVACPGRIWGFFVLQMWLVRTGGAGIGTSPDLGGFN